MKHITIIMSSILFISSYIFAAEYPRNKELSRKLTFKSYIMLHNQLDHYDIATENLVINPGESKKIQLPENLELVILVHALEDKLILKFQDPLPQDVCFTKQADLVEMTYDGKCIKKYFCKQEIKPKTRKKSHVLPHGF